MSEEEKVDEKVEQKEEPNVGNSLLNSLFAAADQPDQVEVEPKEEVEQDLPDLPIGLTDAINYTSQEQPQEAPEEPKEEVEEEKKEEELKKIEKFDRELFEGGLPDPVEVEPPEEEKVEEEEKKPEPKPEPSDDLSFLTEEQRKRISLVEFAEENFEKHKGLKNQYIEFFKKQKEYIDNRLNEDPEAKFDDTDFEYQNFLKRTKPNFIQEDIEEIVELRTIKKAREDAMSEIQPELQKLREEQRVLRVEPKVNELKNETVKSIKDLIPDQMRSLIEKGGPEKAYESNPVDFEIVNKIATQHQDLMFAFHEISQGLVAYNHSNPTHSKLATWIDGVQNTMPDKDGKKFVRREDFAKLAPQEKAKSYTLTDEDVQKVAHDTAKSYINNQLTAHEEKLRKSGFVRAQSVANQEIASIPKQPKPAPREGHSVGSEKATTNAKNPVLTALGL